jgi:hypothetical protein
MVKILWSQLSIKNSHFIDHLNKPPCKKIFAISSYPKLILEVFIRKNFGERYFSFASAITAAVFLFILPGIFLVYGYIFHISDGPRNIIGKPLITWDPFIIVFLIFAIQRRKEIKRQPSVFDFARFSKSAGVLQLWYQKLLDNFQIKDPRVQECYFEPFPFFVLGVLLAIIGQYLGWLLIYCSIVYCLGYKAGYHLSDHWMMDKIDEIIANEEMEKAFVLEEDADQTRGFKFLPRKPKSQEMRRKLMDNFYESTADDVR